MGRRRTLVKKRRRRINKIRTRRRNINKMIKGRGINDSNPSSRNFLNNILRKITPEPEELQPLITKLLNLGDGENIIINDKNEQNVTRLGNELIYSDKFGSYYGVDISDFKNLVGRI